ncbi:unnamed protein product [Sphagnum balticum]
MKRVFGSAISSGVRSMRYCVSVIASSALPVPTAIRPIDSAVIAFTYTNLKIIAFKVRTSGVALGRVSLSTFRNSNRTFPSASPTTDVRFEFAYARPRLEKGALESSGTLVTAEYSPEYRSDT